MKYAYFPGCVIPYKENVYELSTRKVAQRLEIQLIDLKGANCCGLNLGPIDYLTSVVLAARDLSLAEEIGCDLVTLCNGCFGHLTKVRRELLKDQELRDAVNRILNNINREFEGKCEVRHFVQVLLRDIGSSKIREMVTRPVEGLRVAPFYGCHIVKPSDEIGFEDPEETILLDSLIKATGAECVNFVGKNACCGAPIVEIDEKLSLNIARDKLIQIKKTGAEAIVTICPFCHLQLDLNQLAIEEEFSETYNIPVLYYTQLLGLAMGFTPNELGLYENRVPVENILRAIRLSK